MIPRKPGRPKLPAKRMISVRLSPEVTDALRLRAQQDRRPLATVLDMLLRDLLIPGGGSPLPQEEEETPIPFL